MNITQKSKVASDNHLLPESDWSDRNRLISASVKRQEDWLFASS